MKQELESGGKMTNKKTSSRAIAVLFVIAAILAVCFAGCSSTGESSDSTSVTTSGESANATAESPTTYADDDVVNDFITAYNDVSSKPIKKVEQGNIRTKYFATSDGYYLELLHANDTDKIDVTIDETDSSADKGVKGMGNVFLNTAKAIDSSLSNSAIKTFFKKLVKGKQVEGKTLGSLSISFSPDVKISSGTSRGYIEIAAQ
jgi:hypothetical protein